MKMRKLSFTPLLIILLIGVFISCRKHGSDGPPPPPTDSLRIYMTDYYPDSFYHNYATIDITNDSTNLYLNFNGLNDFKFKRIKLLVGDLKHLQNALSAFTTPPTSDVGPGTSDYLQDFSTAPSTYNLTIPRSSIQGRTVYIYAWARMEKYRTDGSVSDFHGAWSNSKQRVSGDAATSYFQFNF